MSICIHKPKMVVFAPVCRVWCKTTDFAAKSPNQMAKLTKERADQTTLMKSINDIIRIVCGYGGHGLIKIPMHSKFWKQDLPRKLLLLLISIMRAVRSY